MLLRKHYIILLLSALLIGNATAREYNNQEINSSVTSTSVSNIVIISGENITLINDNILNVLKNGNAASIKATGHIKLQAGKKIVFKPGTRLTAKKGVSYHACITTAQETKPDELVSVSYLFFKQVDNKKTGHKGYSKGADSGSFILGGSNILAVVVDNQQRKVGSSTDFNCRNLFKVATTNNNNNITKGFSFKPETIKVLRL
jgi:hypothetical protein